MVRSQAEFIFDVVYKQSQGEIVVTWEWDHERWCHPAFLTSPTDYQRIVMHTYKKALMCNKAALAIELHPNMIDSHQFGSEASKSG